MHLANGWGGRRKGAGKPPGSKNRIPRNKKSFDKVKEMVTEIETSNYLHTNDDKKFTGTAAELLQAIYRAESVPIQYRLYAAKAAQEFEPKPIVKPELFETPAEREKRHKELDGWVAMVVEQCARMVARRILGKPKPRYEGGELAIVVKAVHEVMDKFEAEAAEAEAVKNARKGGHRADTTPPLDTQHVVKQEYNGAVETDYKSVAPATPQPPPAQNGHAQPQRVRVMYTHFTGEFRTLAGKVYQADNHGEIVADEDDAQELRERLGARDRR